MNAEQLISRDYRVIGPDEPISHALSIFEESDTIIVMEGKDYRGVLVEKELTRAKLPPNAKVKSFIKYAPKLDMNTPIEEISRLMLESNIYHLPVFDEEKLVGVVKIDDLLKNVIEERFGEEKIENFISKNVRYVSPDDNIGKVIKIFREANITRLPVVEDGKIVGVITLKDLMEKVIHPEDKPEYGEFVAEKKRYLKIPVKGIMTSSPFTLPPDAKVREAVEEMLNRNIGGIIVAEDKKLIGVVTKKDLLEPIASRGKEERIFIQFCGELNKIEGFDKEEGLSSIQNFLRKHESFLEEGYMYVYLKQHKEKRHGLPLIHCKIRLSSSRGMFVASGENYGFRAALKDALNAVEKQIEKEKRK